MKPTNDDNGGGTAPAPAPTVAEILAVAGGLGAGYGAGQVISMSGGTAGLTATTWIPTMAAGAGGVAAAGVAGYKIGQVLNGFDWFKGLVDGAIDKLISNNAILDHSIPEGELPRNFHLYTPNADGSLPWTIKSLEALKGDLQNMNFHDVYLSTPYEDSGYVDLPYNLFDTIEAILTGQPAGGIGGSGNAYLVLV